MSSKNSGNCNDVRLLLPDFARERLSLDDASFVREHLQTCEACRQELATVQDLFAGLSKVPVPAPSPHYWVTLLPRIHQRVEDRSRRSEPGFVARYVLPLVGLALLLAGVPRLFSPQAGGQFADVQSMVQNMNGEEIARVDELDFQGAAGILEDGKADGDREVVLALLAESGTTSVDSDQDLSTPTIDLGDDEVSTIIARLDQERFDN
jgi:hypothetical protein